jgi:hypothetical protein
MLTLIGFLHKNFPFNHRDTEVVRFANETGSDTKEAEPEGSQCLRAAVVECTFFVAA